MLRHAECLTNAYAAEKARRNLDKHFPEDAPQFEKLLARLRLVSAIVDDPGVPLKAKDRRMIDGAIAGRATYLLTGEYKDFGALFGKTVQGVKVVTQSALATRLAERGIL